MPGSLPGLMAGPLRRANGAPLSEGNALARAAAGVKHERQHHMKPEVRMLVLISL